MVGGTVVTLEMVLGLLLLLLLLLLSLLVFWGSTPRRRLMGSAAIRETLKFTLMFFL
jgi:hypothetical protein